jgi:di/tricarboxylate transporter
VNIGGFGSMVRSLANLIAMRLSGSRGAWLSFFVYAIPALMLAAAIGWALLFFRQ